MDVLVVLLLWAAVVLAGVEAFRSRSLQFGWAALACLFAGAFALPASAGLS